MSHLRKRAQTNYYRDLQQYKEDWRLMFRNARTYNQEGSWVYVDAEEMEKVFDEVFDRETRGSGLPGAEPALDEKPARSRAGSRHHSKQVLSEDDDEYLTPSDEE